MAEIKKTLIVPTNWDFELLDFVDDFPEVATFYGKLKSDLIGGGRASYGLPEKDNKILEEWVTLCKKKGKSFCYLLNSLCIGNYEYEPHFKNEFFKFVEWLVKIGVDSVMVSIPYLTKIIKREFPQLKVIASTFCDINSIKRAKLWEEHGVDEITLSVHITRNFHILKKIVEAINIKVHILAHDVCLLNCLFQDCHYLMESHASQHNCNIPYYRYYTTNCRRIFLSNPVEIIRSTFIRPEDLDYYRNIGITSFKLIDRNKPTNWIKNAIKAYAQERYNGNLADIISLFSWYGCNGVPELIPEIETKSVLELQSLQSLIPYIYINNNALDGFLEGFLERRCEELICDEECTYCMEWAEKVISIDEEKRAIVLRNLEILNNRMELQKF